jgi:hypothetical protein
VKPNADRTDRGPEVVLIKVGSKEKVAETEQATGNVEKGLRVVGRNGDKPKKVFVLSSVPITWLAIPSQPTTMDPQDPTSFNHRTERIATGQSYHFVDQLPENYDSTINPTLLCVHGFPDLWYTLLSASSECV